MSNTLLFGAAKKKITPSNNLMPKLYGLMGSKYGGVIDDLYVRVMALDNGSERSLIIGFDLDKAPYPLENMTKISTEHKLSMENILYFSIHTHTAPLTGNRPNEGPNRKEVQAKEVQEATALYETFVQEQLHQCVKEALSQMVEATLSYGMGESYINVNRSMDYHHYDSMNKLTTTCGIGLNFKAEVDRTLFVLKVTSLDNQALGFFINYPVHNTAMISNTCFEDGVGISSDIGGNVSQNLEAFYEGSVALWSSGAAGDVNPFVSNQVVYPDPMTGEIIQLQNKSPEMALASLKLLSSYQFMDVQETLQNMIPMVSNEIHSTVEWSITPGTTSDCRIRLHLLKLGDISFYGIGGELYSSLAPVIRKAVPDEKVVIINHEASMIEDASYVFDDDAFIRTEKADKGRIHATHHTVQQPGYMVDSLSECTKAMFGNIRKSSL